MKAVLAIDSPRDLPEIISVLQLAGYEIELAGSKSALEKILALNSDANLVVFSLSVVGNDFVGFAENYPHIKKIAVADYGWAAASELSRLTSIDDIILGAPVSSSIFTTITALQNPTESTAAHAYFRWIKSWMNQPNDHDFDHESVQEKLADNSENGKLERAMIFQMMNQRFFNHEKRGSLSQTHFSALLYRLFKTRFSGILHLWKPGIHWCFALENGLPYALDARDEFDAFSFETWLERADDNDQDINEISSISAINGHKTQENTQKVQYTEWVKNRLLQSFTWPDAQFECREGNRPLKEIFYADFSENDLIQLIFKGICEFAPKALILEVTQSCLSNFLKLKDNVILPELDHGHALAVVEKLKKGDTLTEMLASFDTDYPVHQVVYLGLIMGILDWIA